MKVVYSDKALLELKEAVEWFENQEAGLGKRFRASIVAAIRQVKQFPMSGRNTKNGIQIVSPTTFKYKIAYEVNSSTISIVRIWHSSRNTTL